MLTAIDDYDFAINAWLPSYDKDVKNDMYILTISVLLADILKIHRDITIDFLNYCLFKYNWFV